jgi:adenylosuccinate synthase
LQTGIIEDAYPMHNPSVKGYADLFLGLQYGDEGKGRVVDLVSSQYHIIARHNGGPNAGHSVQANGHSVALHQLPSGVSNPEQELYIGHGCVVDIEALDSEILEVESALGTNIRNRLRISAMASVIQPHHVLLDRATMRNIGTTGKGIGPAYAAQAQRMEQDRRLDLRIGDLLANPKEAFATMRMNAATEMERIHSGVYSHDRDEAKRIVADYGPLKRMAAIEQAFERLRPSIDIDPLYLCKQIRRGMRVLLEGAQAFGLDRIYGTPPYVTSSALGSGAALHNAGIPPEYLRHSLGIVKLIPSRVGYGPFVSEFGGSASEEHCMHDGGATHNRQKERELFEHHLQDMLASGDPLQVGQALRVMTNEYGVTSGRPRRLGSLDLVQLQTAAKLNGITGIYCTKLDVLSLFSCTQDKGIPYVSSYAIEQISVPFAPSTETLLRSVTPQEQISPAFSEDISNVRSADALPQEAHALLKSIEEGVEVPILGTGVGPSREQFIFMCNTPT